MKLRVVDVAPAPKFTAMDSEFAWMEATTGRPKKEEGKMFLRIPKEEAAKMAKLLGQPSSSGRLIDGQFYGRDSGPILPMGVSKEVPFYLQMGKASKNNGSANGVEDMETASGSLIVAPKPRSSDSLATTPASATERHQGSETSAQRVASPAIPEGPKVVLFRAKPGDPIELRPAKSAQIKNGVCEVVGMDGKLALLGQRLLIGILPLPPENSPSSPEQIQAVLQAYADLEKKVPESATLLAESRAQWEKRSEKTVASASSLPTLEDVETAAGVEEPVSHLREWLFAGAALIVAGLLGWVWRRKVV